MLILSSKNEKIENYKASIFEMNDYEKSIENNNQEKCLKINQFPNNRIAVFGNFDTFNLRNKCIQEIAINTNNVDLCKNLTNVYGENFNLAESIENCENKIIKKDNTNSFKKS